MLHRQLDMLLTNEISSDSWTLETFKWKCKRGTVLYFKHVVVNSFYFRSVQKPLYCMVAYFCLLNTRLTYLCTS